jgi:Zn-finger nucleic acid-binding protein
MMSDRQGVEIDYCPQCRGIWLDRGELDKIIERSGVPMSAPATAPSPAPMPAPAPAPSQLYRSEVKRDDHNNNYGHDKKKRENFLGDLFDF